MSVEPAGRGPELSSLRIDRDALEQRGSGTRVLRWAIVAAILLGLSAAALVVYRQWIEPLRTPEVDITLAVARAPERASALLTATGYIVAQRKAAVTPKIAGRLAKLSVVEGSRVRKGEVIGRIENLDIQARLEEARRELDVARAAHAEALAREEEARREFARQERLLAEGVSSQADFDGADARYKVARAQVDSSAAAIPRAEASVTVAEVALEDTLLVSPFDGVVTVKNSEIGEIVAPVSVGSAARGNSVVEIADMGSLEAEVDINETHISRVREGQPARIILDAFPDRPYPGILRQIVPTANRQKATIEAKVAFTEKGPEVLPEMSARVTFMEEGTPAAAGGRPRVFISHRAVASRGGGPVVLVVRAGRVSVVSIELGPDVEGQVEVLEGLSGGESLVLEPDDSIADGDKVRIRAAS